MTSVLSAGTKMKPTKAQIKALKSAVLVNKGRIVFDLDLRVKLSLLNKKLATTGRSGRLWVTPAGYQALLLVCDTWEQERLRLAWDAIRKQDEHDLQSGQEGQA